MEWTPRTSSRAAARTIGEIAIAVAVASGIVALLDPVAPASSLSVIYLLSVLVVAVRRGGVAALGAAVLSVMTFNFLFIEPRYQPSVARSEDVVALVVFLIAAVVVGRLAGIARDRAREAEDRARAAAAREREAKVLAATASAVLGSQDLRQVLSGVAEAVDSITEAGVRIAFGADPRATGDEIAVPLAGEGGPGWVTGRPDAGWDRDALERLAGPLANLIDVARERGQAAERAAEAEAARRTDVAKTALLHAISHDLRSPLTAITTAASGLSDGAISPADRSALLDVLETESTRLARLVDDLLDLSRIEAGAVEPQLDWCDLHEIAARAATQIRQRRGLHPIDIELQPDLPLVRGDAIQLERVLCNLLDNAVKFSPDEAAVRVTGGVGAGRVHIRVTDRGRGIPLSRRPHVFEPFFRGREGREGSGLGLAICRGFVEANGGEIRLQADAEAGTSFAVSFPLERQPATAS